MEFHRRSFSKYKNRFVGKLIIYYFFTRLIITLVEK